MRYFPLFPLSVAVTNIIQYFILSNSGENAMLYNIVTATERGNRGKYLIGFPSLTFQNPEEGGNKPPKHRY